MASSITGAVGTGSDGIGAHVFSWGMSYAYGQAFHDVKTKAWFDD